MSYLKSTIDKVSEYLDYPFIIGNEPKSIILNFSDENNPHGCKRKCSYCNWKSNPLAQQKIYPDWKVLDKYLEDHSGFITLSGGGDPLYNYEQNKEEVHKLIDYLYDKKLFVRVITRERDNYYKLREKYPYILGSFSIDSFEEIIITDDEFIEYSIVLNKNLAEELFKTRFQCCKDVLMVFREPLQTDYKIPLGLRYNIQHIYKKSEFSTEKLCYEAYYIVGNKILQGYEIFK